MAVVVKTVLGSHFGVIMCTSHVGTYFGGIGMFTGGTHGQIETMICFLL